MNFTSADEFVPEWMWQYDHERPNMGLGDVTAETAADGRGMASTSDLR